MTFHVEKEIQVIQASSDMVDSARRCFGSKPLEKNFPVDLVGVVVPSLQNKYQRLTRAAALTGLP